MAYNGKRILNHVAYDMYLEEMDINCPERFAQLKEERIAREINQCYEQREREEMEQVARETELAWKVYEAIKEAEEFNLTLKESCELRFWDEILEDEAYGLWLMYEILEDEPYSLWLWDEILEDDDELYVWAEILEKIQEEDSFIKNIQQKNTRAGRRKQEARHKCKMNFNAKVAIRSIEKRFSEDCNNMTSDRRIDAINAMNNGEAVQLAKALSVTTRCKRRGGRWIQRPKSLYMQAEELWKRAAKMKLV